MLTNTLINRNFNPYRGQIARRHNFAAPQHGDGGGREGRPGDYNGSNAPRQDAPQMMALSERRDPDHIIYYKNRDLYHNSAPI